MAVRRGLKQGENCPFRHPAVFVNLFHQLTQAPRLVRLDPAPLLLGRGGPHGVGKLPDLGRGQPVGVGDYRSDQLGEVVLATVPDTLGQSRGDSGPRWIGTRASSRREIKAITAARCRASRSKLAA